MACACIGVYRVEKLDDSYRQIIWNYQQSVIEDTCWFSIEFDWHMKPTYTDYEKEQLINVFGKFPEQVIWIFGEEERIFVAAYELISHFGGLLMVNIDHRLSALNKYPGIKIPFYKKEFKNPLKHTPGKYLVDQQFIWNLFGVGSNLNYEKFKLNRFIYKA
jgi:hypothetical protein